MVEDTRGAIGARRPEGVMIIILPIGDTAEEGAGREIGEDPLDMEGGACLVTGQDRRLRDTVMTMERQYRIGAMMIVKGFRA